ncbi:hypothetical protein DI272_18675 [Streptomyces sp. Act143]|nr:hypothetical protein DI272_18675 [Streptomyces sp. Act143]
MIVSGAAATPRVDVKTVLLCDVLADGTVAGVALVEPIYDTTSGARVGTRTVDPVTGAAYTPTGTLGPCSSSGGCNATTTAQILCDVAADGTATQFVRATTYDCEGALLATLDRGLDGTPYTATGTVGVCPTSPDCESPTTPVTSVGLCLADGTPIAVTVVRDCTGAVTSEGWINLTTGAWSAGAVPAGTVACGESRSIQVSGTFCDVDAGGDVVGLVLVEYTYDDIGAIASVRLVDAVTGGTYTPTGTVTVCPAGVEQPERDILELCDTATDGTVTAFVRDYARDENGAIVGHSDYTLDGAPYTPTGTVGSCSVEPCRDSQTVLVCDVPADSTTTITPTITDATSAEAGLQRFPTLPGPYTSLWAGGSLVWPADPGPAPAQVHPVATGKIAADLAGCDGASGTLNVSVRVTNNGPGKGQAWDGALQLTKGTTLLASKDVLHDAPAGTVQTLTLSVPITAAEVAAGNLYVALVLETFHLSSKQWTADQFTMSLELEGCEATTATQFLRTLVTDCETGDVLATTDTTLDGQPYTVTGEVAQCEATAPSTTPCGDTEIAQLCDLVYSPAAPIPVPADSFTLTGNVVVIGDTLQFSRSNVPVTGVAERAVTGLTSGAASELLFDAGWGGGGNPPATNDAIYQVDVLDGTTVLATSTVNLSNGSGSAGAVVAQPPLAFTAPPSGTVTVRFTDLSTGGALNRDLVIRPLTVETEGTEATATPFLRAFTYDCTGLLLGTRDTELDGSTPYTPQGEVSVCSATAGTGTTDSCAKQVIERCGCDDTDGDGIGDVIYTELWAIDPCNGTDPVLLATYEDGDPAKPYTPVAPVECTVDDSTTDTNVKQLLERCGCDDTDGDGIGDVLYTELWAIDPSGTDAPALLGAYLDGDPSQPYTPTAPVECTAEDSTPGPLSTGVRAVTGTAAQDLAGSFPGLQSVSLTVLADTVNVTMTDGSAVPIPAGVTMTWSVAKDEDSALAAASFAGASAAAQFLLNYTYR